MNAATAHGGGPRRPSRSVPRELTRARARARTRALARALALALAFALLAGAVHAHATLVFGVVRVAPDPPAPGEAFTLTLTLEDPSLTPVEDAIVFVELRPMPAADAPLPTASTEAPDLPPPLRSERLIEVAPAVYQTEISLPNGDSYHLLVRDQTFQWEEANASVVLPLLGRPVGDLPFILPPTQVAPQSLWTWIVWLVGLPLLAGVVVTLLVLRSQPAAAKKAEDGA
jgi:hypothetical protein